jgi:very-short-patch-repair endonuclease
MVWRQPQRLPEGIKRAARGHRSEPTPAEARLWERLRRNQLCDAGFRRQHPIGSFILDFYCPAHRLAVEVDGAIHDQQAEYDQARTDSLAAHGIRVIRFRNEEVLDDLPDVLQRIEAALSRG